jgi:hypothetical protein
MSLAEWTQLLSELLVVAALTLTLLQLREANRQNRAFFATFRHNGHVTGREDLRLTFFREDPELLSWYLRSRGYETSTPMEDRRRLYILAKLNLHESRFINHQSGVLGDESWSAWLQVVRGDFALPEYREVWETARRIYSSSFVAFIDEQAAIAAGVTTTTATA